MYVPKHSTKSTKVAHTWDIRDDYAFCRADVVNIGDLRDALSHIDKFIEEQGGDPTYSDAYKVYGDDEGLHVEWEED